MVTKIKSRKFKGAFFISSDLVGVDFPFMFGLTKKEADKWMRKNYSKTSTVEEFLNSKTYSDALYMISPGEGFNGITSQFQSTGPRWYLVTMPEFDIKNVNHYWTLMHEIHHLTEFRMKDMSADDEMEFKARLFTHLARSAYRELDKRAK